MTHFTTLSIGQADPGTGATLNPQVNVGWTKSVDVSAGGLTSTFTLPDNAYIGGARAINAAAVSADASINIGDAGDNNKYASLLDVSAAGVNDFTLAVGITSAKEVIVAASGFTDGNFTVQVWGGIRA